MVALSTSLGVVVLAGLVACSAFFSASEIAIFSTEPRAGEPPERGALGRLREDPHRLLVTILVGNNFVNVAIATLTTTLLVRSFSPETAAIVSTAVVGTVVLVFGEIVPKSYGVGNAERLSAQVARPLELVGTLLYPVVAIFDAVTGVITRLFGGERDIERPYMTREDLAAIVESAEAEGVIEEEEQHLIQRVLQFSETDAADVMVPRADVVGVDADGTVGEALDLCLDARVTRAPVYRGTLDEVVGHVDVRDLATGAPEEPLDDYLRPVLHVYESRPVDEVLADLQDLRVELAVVFDEFGAAEGILTTEDVVEELVGEILDVGERRPVVRHPGGYVLARGKAGIDAVNAALGTTIAATANGGTTLAAVLAEALGRPAEADETVTVDDARITVDEVVRNRVRRVRVERVPADAEGDGKGEDVDDPGGSEGPVQ
jgi:CBS domain containing-hemolysin-like protein